VILLCYNYVVIFSIEAVIAKHLNSFVGYLYDTIQYIYVCSKADGRATLI